MSTSSSSQPGRSVRSASDVTVPGGADGYILPSMSTTKVLTVGSGMMFATIRDAVAAAKDGDTVAVKAGTYTNEFVGYVTKKITMVGVGGMVHMVATHGSPEGKAFIVPQTDFTIRNFEFSGITDGTQWGNLAGIRSEGGDLTVQSCYFHDNQNGLLANPTAAGQNTITVENSEFARNGTGTGFTHNLYTGAFAQGIFRNNYFHDAKVGHELKSRAVSNVIEGNVIANRSGSASYDIDLPNGGVAVIRNNIIEKGPNAANVAMIHYGGEFQFKWPTNSLTVTGNTFVNNMAADKAIGILNHAPLNGLSVTPVVSDNTQSGLAANRLILTAGATYRDLTPTMAGQTAFRTTTPAALPEPRTWAASPVIPVPSGAASLDIRSQFRTITGNAGRLTVTDSGGFNSYVGGTGGLALSITANGGSVSTLAGTTNRIDALGRTSIRSAGADSITINGSYSDVTASGTATITAGNFFDTFTLNGRNVLNNAGTGSVTVGAAGNATVTSTGAYSQITKLAGGRIDLTQINATPRGTITVSGGAASLMANSGMGGMIRVTTTGGDGGANMRLGAGNTTVISGGADTICASTGSVNVTATGKAAIYGGSGSLYVATGLAGASVYGGTGGTTVVGGGGDDVINCGAGRTVLNAGGGNDLVTLGAGTGTLTGGTGAEIYQIRAGTAGGQYLLTDFRGGEDRIRLTGFQGDPIAQRQVTGGSLSLTLTDGTRIQFAGVTNVDTSIIRL